MMIVIILSVAFPVCFIIILIGCLNCLRRKRRLEGLRRDITDGRNGAPFAVDIIDIPRTTEQVTIEPLPDILSKVTPAPLLRPRITYAEKGKHETSVQHSFPRDHLTYLNEVGSGWFGKAIESEAIRIVNGSYKSHVVVKMLRDDASKQEQKQFLDEVHAFRCLEHENLMSLLGQCTEAAPFLVILEFAAHGNLKTFLVENRQELDGNTVKKLFSFALDAASGLACLHRHDYIHNDLAARNCLVMSDYTLKIGDYGISDQQFKNEYYNTGSELLPIRWMAPETLTKTEGVWTTLPHDKSSDIWSFGILLWEISSLGERPYDMLTDEAVLQGVVQDKLVLPSDVDIKLPFRDGLWSIMTRCWRDNSNRLDIEQVYSSLEQLSRHKLDNVDAMSDFDQKWNQLKTNQGTLLNNNNTDLGSRIALAGSFAISNSSPPSDSSSFLDDDTEALDVVKSGDLVIEIGNEYNLISPDQFGNPVTTHMVQPEYNLLKIQHNDVSGSFQDQVVMENELVNKSLTQSHKTPTESNEQPLVAVRNSEHQSPIAINITETGSKDFTNIDKELSFDVEQKSLSKSLESSQKDLLKNSSAPTVNSFIQKEDEEFTEFVRTSPTAPAVDFTDFASAKIDYVNQDLGSNKQFSIEPVQVESKVDVISSAASVGSMKISSDDEKNDDSENDSSSFSDFVTSPPPSNRIDTNDNAGKPEALVSGDKFDSLPLNSVGQEFASSIDSDSLASDISSFVLVSQSEILSPSTTADVNITFSMQEASDHLENNCESSHTTVDNSLEKDIISEKVAPDQNQNVLSSLSSNLSVLNSDAAFPTDAVNSGNISDTSAAHSVQVGVVTATKDSFSQEAIQDKNIESNTDSLLALDDISWKSDSPNINEGGVPGSVVAGSTKEDAVKESASLDEKFLGALNLVSSLLADTADEAENGSEAETRAENEEQAEVDFTENLFGQDLSPQSDLSEVEQNENVKETPKSGADTSVVSVTETDSFKPEDSLLGQNVSLHSDLSVVEQTKHVAETPKSEADSIVASATETEKSLIDF